MSSLTLNISLSSGHNKENTADSSVASNLKLDGSEPYSRSRARFVEIAPEAAAWLATEVKFFSATLMRTFMGVSFFASGRSPILLSFPIIKRSFETIRSGTWTFPQSIRRQVFLTLSSWIIFRQRAVTSLSRPIFTGTGWVPPSKMIQHKIVVISTVIFNQVSDCWDRRLKFPDEPRGLEEENIAISFQKWTQRQNVLCGVWSVILDSKSELLKIQLSCWWQKQKVGLRKGQVSPVDKSNAAYSSSSALKVGRFPVNEVKKEKKKKRRGWLGVKTHENKGGLRGVVVVGCTVETKRWYTGARTHVNLLLYTPTYVDGTIPYRP